MRTGVAVALVGAGTSIALATIMGCSQGSPAAPNAGLDAGDDGGGDAGGYAVCATGLPPSYTGILTQVLNTSSCGTNQPSNCHSQGGSTGTGNLLDFTAGTAAVYGELVGDGGGVPSTNIAGDAGGIVRRVVPGDAGASMLYIKLTLTSHADPRYGSGMPLTAPGSVCPTTLDAVKTWIDQGATNQ